MPIPPSVTPRLKLDRSKTKAQLPANLAATDAEVDAALATINQDALYDAARAEVTVQLWDRESPINGVPAKHFEDRGDLPATGEVFLIVENGVVTGYQPYDPSASGYTPIPHGQGLTKGNAMVDNQVADRVAVDVLDRIQAHIKANRPA